MTDINDIIEDIEMNEIEITPTELELDATETPTEPVMEAPEAPVEPAVEAPEAPTEPQLVESVSIAPVVKKGAKVATLVDKINELIGVVEALQGDNESLRAEIATLKTQKPASTRDRGPSSNRVMTEEDAIRVIKGDLVSASHKAAALTLGLSYGQVYSARKGFTFRHITPIEGS